jgi:nitrite reductase (NADH) small subunit
MSARTINHPHPNPPPEGEGTTRLPLQGEGWDGGGLNRRWIRICAVDEIPRLGARVIKRAGGPNIAVFRTDTDRLFALADRCPHRGGPLSQGIVHGRSVTCPLHNWKIDLASGAAIAPDSGCTAAFATKVEKGEVLLAL